MFLCICVSVLCICISLHKCICVSLYQCICVPLFLCACDIFVSVYMCDSVIKYCTLLKKSLNNQKSVLVLYYCDYESYKNGPCDDRRPVSTLPRPISNFLKIKTNRKTILYIYFLFIFLVLSMHEFKTYLVFLL